MSKTAVIIGLVVLLAVAGGAFALTQNSDEPDDSTTTSQTTTTEADQTHDGTESDDHSEETSANTITYTNDGFSPGSVKVKAGATVTVKNNSSGILEFSSDPHPDHTNEPELNLNSLSPGKSTTFTASEPGSYGFHNHNNEDHTGTLVVEE